MNDINMKWKTLVHLGEERCRQIQTSTQAEKYKNLNWFCFPKSLTNINESASKIFLKNFFFFVKRFSQVSLNRDRVSNPKSKIFLSFKDISFPKERQIYYSVWPYWFDKGVLETRVEQVSLSFWINHGRSSECAITENVLSSQRSVWNADPPA